MDTTDPWKYGAHRISLMRKVGDEETVLCESYSKTHAESLTRLDDYLAAVRKHRVEYNRTVVMAAKKQLGMIERRIEERGAHLREIEAKIGLVEDVTNGKLPPGVQAYQDIPVEAVRDEGD